MLVKKEHQAEWELFDGIPDQRFLLRIGDEVMLYQAITKCRGAHRSFHGFKGGQAKVVEVTDSYIYFADEVGLRKFKLTSSDLFRALPIGEPHND